MIGRSPINLSCALSRAEAAEMLRILRQLARSDRWDDRSDELLDWAALLLPHSAPLQRMKITRLLELGHGEEALATLAQLAQHVRWACSFIMLRTRALLICGRADAAADLVARCDPADLLQHRGLLRSADDVYRAAGAHARRVELLGWAIERHPNDLQLLDRLADALITADRAADATELLRLAGDRPSVLLAEALERSGRTLESLDVLRACGENFPDHATLDAVLAREITLLSVAGDERAIDEALDRIPEGGSESRRAAIDALLQTGQFRRALHFALRLARDPSASAASRSWAWHAGVVAAEAIGRTTLAERICRRLRTATGGGPDPTIMARHWRRALLGQILSSQRRGRLAEPDDRRSVLTPLLQAARATFRRQDKLAPAIARPARLAEHLARCEAALGNLNGAIKAIDRGLHMADQASTGPVARICPDDGSDGIDHADAA